MQTVAASQSNQGQDSACLYGGMRLNSSSDGYWVDVCDACMCPVVKVMLFEQLSAPAFMCCMPMIRQLTGAVDTASACLQLLRMQKQLTRVMRRDAMAASVTTTMGCPSMLRRYMPPYSHAQRVRLHVTPGRRSGAGQCTARLPYTYS